MKTHQESLTEIERDILKAIAKAMIPGSEAHHLPGADDEAIFNDIVNSLGRDTARVVEIISILYARVHEDIEQLRSVSPGSALFEFSTKDRTNAVVLERVVAQCYYRDDRVMQVIDVEKRPPYPKGYQLVNADFSLLKPVIARGKIYRDI